LVLRIQRELKPDTEIAREAQKVRRKAFLLSRDITLFDSEIERNPVDSWKRDKSPEFTPIVFEELDRLFNLDLELGKVRVACDRVKT